MSKAYLLVKDKGVSVESAARKCGVPVTILKGRVRGRINIETIKSGPSPLFSLDEELNFFNHINIMADKGTNFKVQAVVTGKSKTVTVIGAGNAIGNQVPPFFVFPGQRMMPELLDGATPGVQGRVSLSGWSNSEIFDEYMKEHLINYLPALDASNKVLVMYDGHKSHIACRVYTKTLTPSNFQSAFKKCGIFPYNPDVIPEVALAPSQSFPVDDVLTSASVVDVECPTTVEPFDVAMAVEEEKANSPSDFFDKQGGEVLKNLKVRKVRKTLSKVVGGKPITEDCVMEAVQKHYAEQKNPKKSIKNAVNESQVAGCSGEGNKRKRPVETTK
ncbi:hypothetical protein KUTeg_003852 [Tegillarca granosa]|uniref:DDE-1 domain-containing protein n=1 Tax=Tegillarca granosa TaxID=220873 RepID=A0ABQ9FRI5_TEGGR|nr:hypothetical protein KUTeg_003852 [Tegillarca granosa]